KFHSEQFPFPFPFPFGEMNPFSMPGQPGGPGEQGGPGEPGAGDEKNAPREFRIPQRGLGSGILLAHHGRGLTHYHVMQDMENLKVILPDKRSFDARVLGKDPKTDIAVIELKGEVPKNLPYAKLGDSDKLEVGELVLAIGAPFGFTQSVTSGIISAKGRSN